MTTGLLFTSALLFLFNVNIVGPLAVSSVGLAICAFLVVVAFLERRIAVSQATAPLLGLVVLIFLLNGVIGIGHVFGGRGEGAHWVPVVGWVLLIAPFMAGWIYNRLIPSPAISLLSMMACAGFAVAALLVTAMVGMNSAAVRFDVSEVLVGGINGYTYGLFSLQAMFMFLAGTEKTWPRRLVFYSGLVLPVVLGLLLGSRQYIGGVLLFAGVMTLLRSSTLREVVGAGFRILGLSVALTIVLLQFQFTRTLIASRVLSTISQTASGSGRLDKVEILLSENSFDNLTGFGPGAAVELLDAATDSFYLEYAYDYGMIALFSLSIVLVSILVWSFIRLRRNGAPARQASLWAHFLVTVVWFAQFNELVREPYLWLMAGALLGRLSETSGQRAVGKEQ